MANNIDTTKATGTGPIIDRIHEFDRFGINLGMERLEELLRRLGNPQEGMSYIHVAGTNGKGSVCRFIESALSACGYRVGMYISPFIEVFNERIQYDGRYISDDELEEYGWQAVRAAEEMVRDGLTSPTEFEVVMAIAFLYYHAVQPDIVILECGMGGEGDATNVIRQPLACAFTSVSFDHMQVLGNTLTEIAATKAGIIKDGAPVISNVKDPEAAEVIRRIAAAKGSALTDVSQIPCSIDWENPLAQQVSVKLPTGEHPRIETRMTGVYQAENLKTALAVMDILEEQGKVRLDPEKVREGLGKASWPGRFEVVRGREEWLKDKTFAPMVVLDGAHNEAGAAALQETVQKCFDGQKILLVTGVLADKAVDQILDHFTQITQHIIVTEPESPRKMTAADLAEKLRQRQIEPEAITGSAEESLKAAEDLWDEYDIVLFAGSLYLIGAIRRMIRNGYDNTESNN